MTLHGSILFGLLWPAAAAPAAVISVCTAGPPTCDAATIANALTQAAAADIIELRSDISEAVTLTRTVSEFRADGARNRTWSAAGNSATLFMDNTVVGGVTLRNLVLSHASGTGNTIRWIPDSGSLGSLSLIDCDLSIQTGTRCVDVGTSAMNNPDRLLVMGCDFNGASSTGGAEGLFVSNANSVNSLTVVNSIFRNWGGTAALDNNKSTGNTTSRVYNCLFDNNTNAGFRANSPGDYRNNIFTANGASFAFGGSGNAANFSFCAFADSPSGLGGSCLSGITRSACYVNPGVDFHVKAGSLSIDSGAALALAAPDKDGVARPQGAAYEIGPYEYQPPGSPTFSPTASPFSSPSASPSSSPTASPTPSPTASRTSSPTSSPTPSQTVSRTSSPTSSPSSSPSASPSSSPTSSPTPSPSASASASPTASPSASPTPSTTQSASPSVSPTASPTDTISLTPSLSPTFSGSPTISPTATATPTPGGVQVRIRIYDSAGMLRREMDGGPSAFAIGHPSLSARPFDPSQGPLLISESSWSFAFDGKGGDGLPLPNDEYLIVIDSSGSLTGHAELGLSLRGAKGPGPGALSFGPNPLIGRHALLRLDWAPAMPLSAELYALSGERVLSLGTLTPPSQIPLNLPSGIYWLVLRKTDGIRWKTLKLA